MRNTIIYIVLATMLFSCQKPELTEPDTDLKPGEVVSGEVKVSFTAMLPSAPQTKAMGEDPTSDIESMHRVIFDGNGIQHGLSLRYFHK